MKSSPYDVTVLQRHKMLLHTNIKLYFLTFKCVSRVGLVLSLLLFLFEVILIRNQFLFPSCFFYRKVFLQDSYRLEWERLFYWPRFYLPMAKHFLFPYLLMVWEVFLSCDLLWKDSFAFIVVIPRYLIFRGVSKSNTTQRQMNAEKKENNEKNENPFPFLFFLIKEKTSQSN